MTVLLCVGDSNSNPGNGYVLAADQWGSRVANILGIDSILSGVSGEKAAGLRARLPQLLALHLPTHVAVMIGTNDMAGGLETPMSELLTAYLNTMSQIIDIIKGYAIPIIISPPAIEQPQESLRYLKLVDGLRDLCIAKDCAFFDLYNVMVHDACVMTPSEWLQWYRPEALDLYHLSTTGHARLATAFCAAMAPFGAAAEIPPPPPPGPTGDPTVVFQQTLESHFGNISNSTIKGSVIPSTPAHACNYIRVTIAAHADEALTLDKLIIGGIHFGPVTVPQGQTLTLPWKPFNWTPGTPIAWSCFTGYYPTADKLPSSQAFGTTWHKYGDLTEQAGTAGFASYSPYHSLITKIEMSA